MLKTLGLALVVAFGIVMGIAGEPDAEPVDTDPVAGQVEVVVEDEGLMCELPDTDASLSCDILCVEDCVDIGIPAYKCNIICGC